MERFEIASTVGSGAQHHVGRLENGKLIKYPHWQGQRWDTSDYDSVTGDKRILDNYNIPIPETRVVREPVIDNGHSIIRAPYAIIAEEIRGRIFREVDLSNPKIREQVVKMTAASLEIRQKTRAGIDFLGIASFGHFLNYLTRENRPLQLGAYNILVDGGDTGDSESIKLIDTSLLDPKRAPAGTGWLIDRLIDLQNGLMAYIIDDKELKKSYHDCKPAGTVHSAVKKLHRISRRIEEHRQSTPRQLRAQSTSTQSA
jgi:hypothetical protein